MARRPHPDHSRGCLAGLAVGDALGSPLEGLGAHQIREHYGFVETYVDGARAWRRKPLRWRLPGLYSDDTQQALALSDVLIRSGDGVSADPGALADLYLRLARPRGDYAGAHRSIAKSFFRVLESLERGASPRTTGQASAGSGAATRIAPIAIRFAALGDPGERSEEIFEAVMAASAITHRDVRALAGAMAVTHALIRILRATCDGGRFERGASLLFHVAADTRRAESWLAARHGGTVLELERHVHAMSSAIAAAERVIEAPRARAFATLAREANRHGAFPECRRATMGFAPALIPCCLYLLLSTESFEDALLEAVNLGGDADTAGAILGALAGAAHGLGAIPERWLKPLRNFEGVDARARALAEPGSVAESEIPDFVETERALSAAEAENRARLAALHRIPLGGDRGGIRSVDR